jgi:hypothetical protein
MGNNSEDGSLFDNSVAPGRAVRENLACLNINQICRGPEINENALSLVNLFEVIDCTGDNTFRCRVSTEKTDRNTPLACNPLKVSAVATGAALTARRS